MYGHKTLLRAGISSLFLFAWNSLAYADGLLDVYYVAEKQDPVLRAAEATRQGALARHKQSTAALLPQADATANYTSLSRSYGGTASVLDDDTDSTGLGLTLTQPIYHHDQYKQLAITRAQINQSDAEFEATQRNLMLRVAQAYFEVLAAIDNVDFIRAEKEAVGRQLEQTKQRFEVGLIAITDVHEAQAAYDLVVANEILAENLLSSSREALRELTGEYHDSLSPLKDELPLEVPAPPILDEWVQRGLQNNYTLLAAQAAVEAAQQEMLRERAGHYPYVDLLGSYNYVSDAGASVLNEDSTTTQIAVQLTVPLSRGGGTMARTAERAYALEQAKENLEKTRRTVQRQVSDAFLNVQSNISRVKALAQALISTESALKASEAGLEVGTRTTVDVLNTRRELFRAQRDQARAKYDYVLSLFALKEAAGDLTIKDFETANQWLK